MASSINPKTVVNQCLKAGLTRLLEKLTEVDDVAEVIENFAQEAMAKKKKLTADEVPNETWLEPLKTGSEVNDSVSDEKKAIVPAGSLKRKITVIREQAESRFGREEFAFLNYDPVAVKVAYRLLTRGVRADQVARKVELPYRDVRKIESYLQRKSAETLGTHTEENLIDELKELSAEVNPLNESSDQPSKYRRVEIPIHRETVVV